MISDRISATMGVLSMANSFSPEPAEEIPLGRLESGRCLRGLSLLASGEEERVPPPILSLLETGAAALAARELPHWTQNLAESAFFVPQVVQNIGVWELGDVE
jgi:hypothetical protein